MVVANRHLVSSRKRETEERRPTFGVDRDRFAASLEQQDQEKKAKKKSHY